MNLELIDYEVSPADHIAKVGSLYPPLKIHCADDKLTGCKSCPNSLKVGEVRTCCCQLGLTKIT